MDVERTNRATGNQRLTARRQTRWTKTMRAAFLDHLAATCNVTVSAAAIGVTTHAVYVVRRRDPAFAAAWEEALALGYTMLETLLVGQALAGDAGADISTGAPIQTGGVSVDLALRLLTCHRNATGKPNQPGPKRGFAKPDDSDAALIRKLAQIEARRAKALAISETGSNDAADSPAVVTPDTGGAA